MPSKAVYRQQRYVRLAVAVARRAAGDRRVRYLFAGGVAAMVYFAIFSGGWVLWGDRLAYLVIAALANLATVLLTYPLYRVLVFRSTVIWRYGFPRFYLISLWPLAVSIVVLPFMVELAGIPVLLAQALAIVITPLINYPIQRTWTFRAGRRGRRSGSARSGDRVPVAGDVEVPPGDPHSVPVPGNDR